MLDGASISEVAVSEESEFELPTPPVRVVRLVLAEQTTLRATVVEQGVVRVRLTLDTT